MKVKFLTSVAGSNYAFEFSKVYDLPAAEAEQCVNFGWAVPVEGAVQPDITAPHLRGREKTVSRKAREQR